MFRDAARLEMSAPLLERFGSAANCVAFYLQM